MAGRRQQIAEHIAHHRSPRVPDVQRPRRIGADEFHLDLFPGACRKATVPVLLIQNIFQNASPYIVFEHEIQKAGAGDLRFFNDAFRIIEVFLNRLSDFARVLSGLGGQNHRDIGGVVPVLRIGRHFDFDARKIHVRQQSLAGAGPDGTRDQGNQFLFHEYLCKPFL